jgi:hypothetical protein
LPARKLSRFKTDLNPTDPSLTSEEHLAILGTVLHTASTSGMVRLGYADHLFLENWFTRVDPPHTVNPALDGGHSNLPVGGQLISL